MSNPIDNYNKIVTTVNSVTSDYSFDVDANNLIVIDTSNNRIGINTVYPQCSIHISGDDVSSGIITPYLQIDGNLYFNNLTNNNNSNNIYFNNQPFITKNNTINNKNIIINNHDTNGEIQFTSAVRFLVVPEIVGGLAPVESTIANIGDGNIYGTMIGKTAGGAFGICGGFFSTLEVYQNSTFKQDLTVNQDLIVENDISVNQKLKVGGDVSLNSKLFVEGDASFSNTVEIAGQLHGPSSFIIDPAPIGDINGKVQIKGDLEVLGNQTIIHSNIVDICDNRIRLNALDDVNAGIDISINNTTKSVIYESNENTWKIDDASLNVEGNLTVNNVQYAHVPAGAVLSFAMDAAPNGWLLCNGATVSRTTYANLFHAIGVLHGAGDGSNTFQLPDLKDRFVRSSGDNNSVGDTNDGSTAKPTTKNFDITATTSTEGSHNHEIRWTQNTNWNGGGTKTGIKHTSVHINNANLYTGEGNVGGMIGNNNGSHNHTVTVTDNLNENWDDETAPTHIVLLYCIKF